jgi:hypothetical protein
MGWLCMVETCSSSHEIFRTRALSQDIMAHYKVVKIFEVKRIIKVLKWTAKVDVSSCEKSWYLEFFPSVFVCDKFQFGLPVLDMIQIDSAQVFNIQVIACQSLFPLVPRTWISAAWEASFEDRKLGIHTCYRSFFGNLMTKTPTKATRSLFTGYSIFKSLPNWVVTQTLSELHMDWKLCPTSNTIYGWFCKSKIAILIKLNFCQPLPNFKLVIFSKDQKKSIKIRGNL